MAKYIRKDSEVHAIVWNTANWLQMRRFVGTAVKMEILEGDVLHVWNSTNKDVLVPPGHYLIRPSKKLANYEVMNMDDFEEMYEKMYHLIVDEN